MAQVYNNMSFRNKIVIPTISIYGALSFRKQKAEMCYLYYCRTRRICRTGLGVRDGGVRVVAHLGVLE